jgi:transcriptional regulator with XRE-family HTH domain
MTETSFGKTLAKLRKERKLTQQQLADLLHVTNKTISKWETNTTAPDIDTLKRISQVLNVPVDVLLGNSKLTITEKSSRHKLTKRKIILLIALLLVSIFFVYYLMTNFIINTKSYSLISGDERFTIEGNITADKNQYYLSLEVKGINDDLLENKTINNAEYSIIINDKIIYNNGDISTLAILTDNQSLSKYISKISINHTDKKKENLKSVLEDGITLQIKSTDESNKIDTLNIPVLVKND